MSDPIPQFGQNYGNFEKYKLFYGLKKWSSIENNCIFSIMEFDIAFTWEAFIKINYGIFHNWSDLTPFWKILIILKFQKVV